MSKSLNDLSKSQIQAVLDFLNKAQNPSDITDIQQYKPNITEDELKSYSIGESAAANILETRKQLRSERFNSITEVLAVKGVGEDKVMDIVRCIWQSAEETFRSYLFGNMLGGNWKIVHNYSTF